MAFHHSSRHDLSITGRGTAASGNAGNTPEGNLSDSEDSVQKAIYLNPLVSEDYASETYHNIVTIKKETGAGSQRLPADTLNVTASMSKFSACPTTSTELSCAFRKPAGYTGAVYVEWFAVRQLQANDPETCIIEPPAADATSFHLLSNDDYKYLAYDYTNSYDLKHGYNLAIATTERINDIIDCFSNSKARIYCNVLLEDGSWGTSNIIEFTNKGWPGGSGTVDPDPTPTTDDEEAAAAVVTQIDQLPDLFDVTLEDANAIAATRAAYDSLTKLQQSLIQTSVLMKLENLEHQIEELQQAADQEAAAQAQQTIREQLDALAALPKDLSQLDPGDPNDDDTIAAARSALETAISAYNDLTDTQKALIPADLLADLNTAVVSFEQAVPAGTPLPTLVIALTDDMITVDSATYTGTPLKPAVTVAAFGKDLIEGTDYTVSYTDNVNVGTGTAVIVGKGRYGGVVNAPFTIAKAKNPMTVKGKTAKVKYKKVRKKNQALSRSKVLTVSKAQGTVTYAKSSGNKKITINKKTGKVTVKKKLKKGTYKIKVKVTAAGNSNYQTLTKTVTFKVKVK